MEFVRTPEARFENLKEYDFDPNYLEIVTADGTPLRIHYLDEGPRDGELILCMHGQPSWSFLYRKMIPLLTEAGFRVIAPDLVGFGKSDKPISVDDYSYQAHVDWMTAWLTGLDINDITLVCQDWGGLIGLRLAGEQTSRFKRLVVANTTLPASNMVSEEMSETLQKLYEALPEVNANDVREQFAAGSPSAFLYWIKYCASSQGLSVRDVFGLLSNIKEEAALDGYEAPFPDETHLAGVRKFPSLVPLRPAGKPDRLKGDAAWEALEASNLPVLTAFSDRDPVSRGGEKHFIDRLRNVTNVTIKGGGHFLQDDRPHEFSEEIIRFMRGT
ncbi:MAG: haloalkane dehalogenase [Henriciella sp.]